MAIKNVEDVYPLSPMQQGMYFHSLYAPGSGVYVEQVSGTLRGILNVDAFQRAWQRVVDRHTILRTGFTGQAFKEPVQAVYRNVLLPMEQVDWRADPSHVQAGRLAQQALADREAGFDLAKPPLMRLRLIRLDDDAHRFIWTYHHILLDGWSMPLLFQEVMALYGAFSRGEDPKLDPPRPFRDYIVWLRRQDTEAAERFWRQTLEGFVAPTPFVVDTPPNDQEMAGYGEAEIYLSKVTTDTLKALAQQHRLTLNTLVQAAWALLLSRYSGEKDVVFGATVSGRPPDLAGSEFMLGLFINTLPMRVHIPEGVDLMTWLDTLQSRQLEMRQYEYSPLVEIQGWSEVARGQPLFNSILVYENYPTSSTLQSGDGPLRIEDIESIEQTNYPLNLIAGADDRLMLRIIYERARFEDATAARMLGHLDTLLGAMIANPGASPEALPVLTEPERRQILVEWNATATPFPDQTAVHHLFEQQAAADPEAIALRFQGDSMTYDELNGRANQLARVLGEVGVTTGTLVGLCLERSFDMIVALLGILKAGGAYLPLDADYPRERLAYMLADSQAPVLVTHSALLERLPADGVATVCVDRDAERIAAQDDGNLDLDVGPEDLAYVIYTSGSTGQPKGVLLAHRGVCSLMGAVADVFDISAATRMLQFSSLSFDASVVEILGTLTNGGRLCLARRETLLSPGELVELVQGEGITILHMPPSLLTLLDPEAFETVETVASVGEACPPQLARQWSRRYRFLNGYGPTEATVATSICTIAHLPVDAPRVPIGGPLANTQVYVLDGRMQPVPVGVPGELYVSGIGLARGYLNRPELTAERFVPNPFSEEPGARMYKAGDLVRWLEDGTLDFLGRIDHQVKIRGFRVELGEIEAALTSQLGVAAAVVLLREDRPGNKRLVAYLQPEKNTILEPSSIRRQLEKTLPDYMVPQDWVILDRLPLTPNGKVDRHALPAPDGDRTVVSADHVAARDALEVHLTQIWEEVLGVERVGVTDSFFDLGGHSLLAVRAMAKIQERLGETLSLADFFRAPTIEQLAMAIRERKGALASLLVPLREGDGRRPLFFIHPSGGSVHWYADLARHLPKERPFYGIQAQGLDGKAPLDTHIEDMAARYINAIKTVQPDGPYLLGSWSLGVIIAYEMARQLEQQNEQVAFLGLLDQGPSLPLAAPRNQAEYLADTFGQHVPVTLADLNPLTEEDQIAHLFGEAKRVRFLMPDVTLEQFGHFVHMLRTQSEAWRNYRVQPYSGRITLFRARKRPKGERKAAPDLGWGDLARGGVEIHQVPGDHLQMVHEPWVRILERRLTSCLKDLN